MKPLRITLWLLGATLALAAALVGTLVVWSGAASSLARSLDQLTRFLPAGQTLQVKDVTGSLRGGGTIGWLHWQRGDLSVEAHDVRVAWALRPLLDGELRLGQVTVRHLRIDHRRGASALTAPTELRLPLKIDLPFSVATLEWVGPPTLPVTGLNGRYIFDGKEHRLDIDRVQISSGSYRLQGHLQARAPMALLLQVDGSIQRRVPSSQRSVTVQAHAEVAGSLSGPHATLALQARLRPQLDAAPADAMQAMQASVTASLQPWQPQPLASAHARWQGLDLAALWPQAPQTRLVGEATVTPAGPGWRASVKLGNAQSGPWNQRRLPIESLNANMVFTDGQWSVEALQASGAGGRIEAQGKLVPAPANTQRRADWQGSATLHGINPAALDSRLAATALDGQLTARQAPVGIQFEARLTASKRQTAAASSDATGTRTLAGLRLQAIQAQGRWQAPLLQLETLTVQTDDAQLQGQLSFDTVSLATQGRLALTLPGTQATLAGQLASARGQGELSLQVADAARTTRWLQRWPGMAAPLGGASLQGGADISGHWQGGWQGQGQALQVQASLRAPRLDLRGAGQSVDQDWHLRELQADLSGTLRAFQLTARGQAEHANGRFTLQTQAHGARLGEGVWQASVDSAQLSAQDSLRPGNWTLQLSERVLLDWKQGASSRTLDVAPGSARLSGPVPGAATLSWQAARWAQKIERGEEQSEWQTRGRLQGLPLAWLELLGRTQMANLGLRGDLLFGGQWDASGGDALRLRATLERTGGDLQLLTDDASAGTFSAGVRDARLLISADGERLAASLRWDSERAGQVQANFSTRLQRQDGAWTWPVDAPLAGTLQAQLPPVGAWSLLAPPGWRMRGTLDGHAELSGSRGAPHWRGTLQAQDLALRSVVEGIDFSQGSLRASLDGLRLNLDQFTLQGAGGQSGGRLNIKGAVQWLPGAGAAPTIASRLRMELEAQAQALRVSARADRRLVVSGQLTARLVDARLTIRGTLQADQALFILPEDTAPQLGEDVLVRAGNGRARSAPTDPPAPASAGLRITPDVALTLALGPDFQVRGRGLATRLAGSLELRSSAERALAPRLSGELRTVRGTYKAYGQQLEVEEGVLRFFGPYDNPALDILALRPNLQQRVGVQINGTALSPVVRLYAEPDLPDAEKLAWLVLGHSAASGGGETALLQQAALALLGGKGRGLPGGLAAALGLDEVSLRGGADGSIAGATVTLGKRVSRDFYIAYEHSLAGTLGTFFIFYDLSRRFTLRAQTGAQSAVDLIFTLRYD